MPKSTIRLLIALAITFHNPIYCTEIEQSQPSKVPEWVTVAKYTVSGHSKSSIREQLNKFGPFDGSGIRHDALTEWNITWKIKSSKVTGQGQTFELKATIILPICSEYNLFDPDLKRDWDTYMEKLFEHEMKHIHLACLCQSDMIDKIKTFNGSDPNAFLAGILSKYIDKEKDMDLKTGNGKLEGVVFQ